MKLSRPSFIKDSTFKNRIIVILFGLSLLIWGKISQHDYLPAKWMTYRNFDIPKQKNFINYLLPGVPDSSSRKVYNFKHKEYAVLYIVLFIFFPIMLFLRLIFDFDLKVKIYRGFTQWLTFVVARLGIFRVTGVCSIKRTGLGVFPFMNCQSCELATGACPLGTFQMSLLNKQIPFALIGQILLVGILSGRAVCGWLCPFGFLSDIFNKIPGKKIILNLKFTYLK
ncbi:MAG: 4Fe-4S binding protein, partial [Spirochaetes bacterium]|nr:4Fe-4S binding protein [Spirochaetota bacterium]